jgi:peptidyl-prolyl cis-trans isomerase D
MPRNLCEKSLRPYMAGREKKPIVTKKHMARLEREKVQTRYIVVVTLFIVIVVIGLIGYGILDEYVLRPSKAVVRVGSDRVTVREFVNLSLFNGQQAVNSYIQNVQLAQMFGYDETYVSSLRDQAQASLNQSNLGNQTLNYLIEDLLIRQEAAGRGITVSDEELDNAMQEQFGYYPNGTPTPKPTYASIPTSTLSTTQEALFPPTSTPTETPAVTPTTSETESLSTATATSEAKPTESPTATSTLVPSATPDYTPTPTLSPTPYTQELYEAEYERVIDDFKQSNIPESTIRSLIESQLYRQKVQEAIWEELNLSPEEEQVWARHILVPDEATANMVLEQLRGGANFADLAVSYSTDTGSAQQGGDLGWFGIGKMVPEFEETAFALQIGEISEPVQSTFGYHIIQVLGHEIRTLSESEYNQLKEQKFQEWLDEKRAATEVVIDEIWRDVVPVLNLPTG